MAADADSSLDGSRTEPSGGSSDRPANAIPAGVRVMVVGGDPEARGATVRRLRVLGAQDVREAATAAGARASARLAGPPDLLVLDTGPADGTDLEVLADLHALGWQHVVVLSEVDDPATARAALQAGAHGYLHKAASAAELLEGLCRVLAGGVYPDPDPALAAVQAVPRATGACSGAAELSGRELEVLQLVADGRTNKQIGGDLGLSALTVKSHLARMGRKLGTGDRAEMVAHGMRGGVIN